MAVNFTANIGLAKPTESESALEWARNTKLQEDNNNIIIAETNIPLTAYTPALIAHTLNPNIGAGTIKGEYQDINGVIMGSFAIVFTDPGVAAGTGEYGVSLPFPVDGTFHSVGTVLNNTPGSFSSIGEGYYTDASTVNTSGILAFDAVTIAGVSYLRWNTETFVGKTTRVYLPGQPFTVANADKIAGGFMYKRT